MPAQSPMPSADALDAIRKGIVIPAHPLALDAQRRLDERRQRALTRYYLAAGAGGVAVGVHSTQFEIRKSEFALLEPVLALAHEEVTRFEERSSKTIVKVAGVCGDTRQAVAEAELAADIGYDAGLLSLAALTDATVDQLIDHSRAVSRVIPIFGFYLQPAVGGRLLGADFWRRFAQIETVVAIKIAPFNRFQTIDVVRAVAEAGRALAPGNHKASSPSDDGIALYTGNDDNIVADLLGDWTFNVGARPITQRIVGGLLGHWAYWTRPAVQILERCHAANARDTMPSELHLLNRQVTDMNAAVFDPSHNYAGCIPGLHEVLRRVGLLEGTWCLNPDDTLSPGQAAEISRVCDAYPHLVDDAFVREHVDEWMM
ncbi:MAG: dihydrodipicolinate synthase family protein [Phycisphaerae bacterium]|nr:dihydrodipicolinate synthase family protein [Phycisphaerae bacterium]